MSKHLEPDALAALALGRAAPPPHLAECAQCAEELASFRDLSTRLRDLPEPPQSLRRGAEAYFVNRRAMDQLIARMIDDPALRARAQASPEAVLRDAGLDPTPALIEALRDIERGDAGAARRLAASLWF